VHVVGFIIRISTRTLPRSSEAPYKQFLLRYQRLRWDYNFLSFLPEKRFTLSRCNFWSTPKSDKMLVGLREMVFRKITDSRELHLWKLHGLSYANEKRYKIRTLIFARWSPRNIFLSFGTWHYVVSLSYRRFGGTCCLLHQGGGSSQDLCYSAIPFKTRFYPTRNRVLA
jgi:hypothetical protein